MPPPSRNVTDKHSPLQLYNDDCLNVLPTLLSNSINLTLTSPPYDNLRDYNGSLVWDDKKWQGIIQQLYRVTNKGGVVVWIVGDATIDGSETGTSFKQALYAMQCGFNLHDTMIYRKNSLTFPDTNRYYQCFEYMFVLSKGKPSTANLIDDRNNKHGGKKVTGTYRDADGQIKQKSGVRNGGVIKEDGIRWNIWEYSIGWHHSYNEEYLRGHPAIFPHKLAKDHIQTWTVEGDTVLDPMMGSGTAGMICSTTSRNFIGMEIDSEYFKIANRRITTAYNEHSDQLRKYLDKRDKYGDLFD